MSVYKTYGIYGIRNRANKKIYVGKTMNSFGDRWDHHKALLRSNKHSNSDLQSDWLKFGEDTFEFVILHDCTSMNDIKNIDALEMSEIAKYKKQGMAYNIHDGGSQGLYLGKHLSEETKKKIGAKNRMNMTGRKLSEQTKLKMSESQKRRFASMSAEERKSYGEMLSEKSRGYTWSEESKRKMENNKNGAKYSLDDVRKIRFLHEKEGKKYSEIADITGIPRHTVYLIATYRRWKDAI